MAQKSAIVIGGGLGGVSSAISLAQNGFSVRLYEKNQHIGGKLNLKEQDGFRFDLGPSILTMPHIFESLFARSGKNMADYIPIVRLEHEWRSFFPDGTILDLYGDLDKMSRENPNLSADDMRQYKNFLDYAKGLDEITTEGYFGRTGLDTIRYVFAQHGFFRSMRGFDYFSTMYGAIQKRVTNQNLRDMLAYFIKYVGSSPYNAPAVLNMMIHMQHQLGEWYVPGGMNKIGLGLVRLAEEIGVEFHTASEVTRLETAGDKRITAAILSDGSRQTADYFISNMEVIPAYKRLLGWSEHKIAALSKFEPACSGIVLHLGVNRQYPQLSHHNFFFSGHPRQHFDKVFNRHELPDDPTLYVVNVNKTDPGQALPGHENLKILPHIPYIQKNPATREDYLVLRERVLEKLERMGLSDLRQHIVTEDFWTPNDLETTYYSDRGAIYGVVSDRKGNHGFKHPKHSTQYDNLYFVGGTVNPGGGMPMVTLSGQQAANLILDRETNG